MSGDQETQSNKGVINATSPHIAMPISARFWVNKRRNTAFTNAIISAIFFYSRGSVIV